MHFLHAGVQGSPGRRQRQRSVSWNHSHTCQRTWGHCRLCPAWSTLLSIYFPQGSIPIPQGLLLCPLSCTQSPKCDPQHDPLGVYAHVYRAACDAGAGSRKGYLVLDAKISLLLPDSHIEGRPTGIKRKVRNRGNSFCFTWKNQCFLWSTASTIYAWIYSSGSEETLILSSKTDIVATIPDFSFYSCRPPPNVWTRRERKFLHPKPNTLLYCPRPRRKLLYRSIYAERLLLWVTFGALRAT